MCVKATANSFTLFSKRDIFKYFSLTHCRMTFIYFSIIFIYTYRGPVDNILNSEFVGFSLLSSSAPLRNAPMAPR